MTDYETALQDANDTVNALTAAATPAPLLALNMAIGIRAVLARHRPAPSSDPWVPTCQACAERHPCADAQAAMGAFAPGSDQEGD